MRTSSNAHRLLALVRGDMFITHVQLTTTTVLLYGRFDIISRFIGIKLFMFSLLYFGTNVKLCCFIFGYIEVKLASITFSHTRIPVATDGA